MPNTPNPNLPANATQEETTAEKLFQEWLSSYQAGDPTTAATLCAEHGDLIQTLLASKIDGFQDLCNMLNEEDGGLQPGRILGDFELVREIGRGGMGLVWEAQQKSVERHVALKILPPLLAVSPKAIQRFHREAISAGHLDHQGLVRVYATGEQNGLRFIAQELVGDGETLAECIPDRRNSGKVDSEYFRWVADIIAQVGEAMQVAHDLKVVHRDIKPSNILLQDREIAKVADFGLARMDHSLTLTLSQDLAGTPYYMSPEHAGGNLGDIGPASDQFSLGSTLYEALTSRPPFEGDTRDQVSRKICEADPIPIREFRSQVPRELEVICLKALEKNPSHRFESMGEFAADLRRWLANEPIFARPPRAIQKALKWSQRNPGKSASLLMGSFAIALITWFWADAERARYRAVQSKNEAERARYRAVQSKNEAERARYRAVQSKNEAELEQYHAKFRDAFWLFQDQQYIDAAKALELCPQQHRGWEWDHLSGQIDLSAGVLIESNPSNPIRSMAISSQGRFICSILGDSHIVISGFDGSTKVTIKSSGASFSSVACSSWDTLIAAGTKQGSVKFFDRTTTPPTHLGEIQLPHAIRQLAFWEPEGESGVVVAGTIAGDIYFVTLPTKGAPAKAMKAPYFGNDKAHHFGPVTSISASPTGSLLTAGRDGRVLFWKTPSSQPVAWLASSYPITALSSFVEGSSLGHKEFFYVADEEGTLSLFPVRHLGLNSKPFWRKEIFPSGGKNIFDMEVLVRPHSSNSLYAACKDGSVREFKPTTFGLGQGKILTGHQGPVICLGFQKTGRVYSGSQDGAVLFWDSESEQRVQLFPEEKIANNDVRIFGVAYNPKGGFASAKSSGMVDVWQPESAPKSQPHSFDLEDFKYFKFDKNSESIVNSAAYKVQYSPDGDYLAAALNNGGVRVWDLMNDKQFDFVNELPSEDNGKESKLARMAWDLDFSYVLDPKTGNKELMLAVACGDGRVRVWNVVQGDSQIPKILLAQAGTRFYTGAVRFSPSGQWLACGGMDKKLRIFDTTTWEQVAEEPGHQSWISCIRFVPDASSGSSHGWRLFCSSLWDGMVIGWEWDGSRLQISNRGGGDGSSGEPLVWNQDSPIYSLAVHPQESRLVFGDDSGRIMLLDQESLRPIYTLKTGGKGVYSLDFSPDGDSLLAGCRDGLVRVYGD
ncbi:MAG: WD40 repeat domain-containing serine/threonine protein kinase [Planctomycetota bacterium]|jgi:serine/threonine protein kinase/WD40 repeat protein|nr:WD40 repeat domain-containing serine/threonine protein kinase [Planctomycetota bacterium]MDP6940893.1 WD40 repeat domain-containing serine/threonine protein kinase [Planctomycetota bacterium]